VASYGEVAGILGLTESRITQITALLELPPAVQEAVLLAEAKIGIREAIRDAREVEWETSDPQYPVEKLSG
jgi:hypothetical protein